MSAIDELLVQRDRVLRELGSMRSMRQGSISKQYLKVRHKGRKKPVLRGPYYVFCRSEGGRTVSKRLRSSAELKQVQQDVAAYKRFVELCRQFEQLTERLGELERQTADIETQKKTPKSFSRATGK